MARQRGYASTSRRRLWAAMMIVGSAPLSMDSCAVAPSRPAHHMDNVWAPSHDVAARVVDVFNDVDDVVGMLIPEGRHLSPPEIWVIDEDVYMGAAGTAIVYASGREGDRIIIAQQGMGERLRYTIAHELIHVYLYDDPILPAMIEEGIACVLGQIVAQNIDFTDERCAWVPQRMTWSQALGYTEPQKLSREDYFRWRWAGITLVEQVGWRKILTWREEKRVMARLRAQEGEPILPKEGLKLL